MVFVRFPSFKTGVNPSVRSQINPASLTPEQKMLMTKNRIWGNMVGGNERSGYKELRQPLKGPARGHYYEFFNLKMIFPFVKNWEKINLKKEKYEERKMRIFMRGVKIGSKRGGDSKSGMSMFEMSNRNKAADPVEAQKETEAATRSKLSDELLNL